MLQRNLLGVSRRLPVTVYSVSGLPSWIHRPNAVSVRITASSSGSNQPARHPAQPAREPEDQASGWTLLSSKGSMKLQPPYWSQSRLTKGWEAAQSLETGPSRQVILARAARYRGEQQPLSSMELDSHVHKTIHTLTPWLSCKGNQQNVLASV